MAKIPLSEILELSVSERVQLAQDIWDSIVQESPESVPVTDAQREELDRRLKAYEEDGEAGASWEEVKKRLRSGD